MAASLLAGSLQEPQLGLKGEGDRWVEGETMSASSLSAPLLQAAFQGKHYPPLRKILDTGLV